MQLKLHGSYRFLNANQLFVKFIKGSNSNAVVDISIDIRIWLVNLRNKPSTFFVFWTVCQTKQHLNMSFGL